MHSPEHIHWIIFNSALNKNTNIDMVIKSAIRRIHTLRLINNQKNLLEIFEFCIPSLLVYYSPLFLGIINDSNALKSTRKQFHRIKCRSNGSWKDFQEISARRLHKRLKTVFTMQNPTNAKQTLILRVLNQKTVQFKSMRREHRFIHFCSWGKQTVVFFVAFCFHSVGAKNRLLFCSLSYHSLAVKLQ